MRSCRNLPGGDQTGDQLRDQRHAQFRHEQPDQAHEPASIRTTS